MSEPKAVRRLAVLARVAGAVVLAALPLYLDSFWLQLGLFVMAGMIGAIGLTLLVGVAGQLSLGHAFFVAVGAYGYAYLAGQPSPDTPGAPGGLGLPPLLALVGAVALAGAVGALFSPISGRLRGIYLGLASLGLVFLGQHVLINATTLTGGYNGRDAQPFSALGFSFSNASPDDLAVLGVPFGMLERLWYLGLLLVAVAWWYARNLVDSRPGRALALMRDSEVAARTLGVDISRYKAAAFIVSSMYAGLAGVLMAVAYGRIVPETFGLQLSIDFLAMIVIGVLGSIRGAALGALFVIAAPLVLTHYSAELPFLAQPGSDGLSAPSLSRLLYGLAIVLVLLFARDGVTGVARRLGLGGGRPPEQASPSHPPKIKETTV